MAALVTQNIVASGVAPTFGAAASSDTAEVGSGHDTFVVYRNANVATRTVTIVVPGNNEYGQANPDVIRTLPAGTVSPDANGELWLPLRREYDNGAGTSRADLTVSNTTGVTVAVVRVG